MTKFKPGKISIIVDDPDEAQEFISGLILAKQNNNSSYFPQLIEGVNGILEPYLDAVAEDKRKGIGTPAKVAVE